MHQSKQGIGFKVGVVSVLYVRKSATSTDMSENGLIYLPLKTLYLRVG